MAFRQAEDKFQVLAGPQTTDGLSKHSVKLRITDRRRSEKKPQFWPSRTTRKITWSPLT